MIAFKMNVGGGKKKITQILLCCVLTVFLIIHKTSQLLISLSYLTLPTVVEVQPVSHVCHTHARDGWR